MKSKSELKNKAEILERENYELRGLIRQYMSTVIKLKQMKVQKIYDKCMGQ